MNKTRPPRHAPLRVVVDVAFFDFHGTLAVPSQNRTQDELFADLVWDHTRVRLPAQNLGSALRTIRQTVFGGLPMTVSMWIEANRMAVERCGGTLSKSASRAVHEELVQNDSLWVITEKRLDLLRYFSDCGVRACIASNGPRDSILRVLKRHGLASFLIPARIYTAEQIGIQKPSPLFFRALVHGERVPVARTIFYCNSPRTDLGSIGVGIRTVLVHRREDVRLPAHPLLHTFSSPAEALAWTKKHVQTRSKK